MNQKTHEAMTALELSEAQNQHIQLDDAIRRRTGRLTIDQKTKVLALMESMLPKEA